MNVRLFGALSGSGSGASGGEEGGGSGERGRSLVCSSSPEECSAVPGLGLGPDLGAGGDLTGSVDRGVSGEVALESALASRHAATDAVLRELTLTEEEQLGGSGGYTGQVLTIQGGVAPLPAELEQLVALLEDGRLLVAPAVVHDTRLLAFLVELRLREDFRLTVRERVLTPPAIIAQVVYDANKRQRVFAAGASQEGGVVPPEVQLTLERLLERVALLGSSDLHIDAGASSGLVRFRVEAGLQTSREGEVLDAALARQLLRALFHLSDDSSGASYDPFRYPATRVSGSKLRLPDGVTSLRCQITATANSGEHGAVRMLYRDSMTDAADVDALGYADEHVRDIRSLRRLSSGVVIISGVTGSGKSTALQKLLQNLVRERQGRIHLVTLEDPPEYHIQGATQIPVAGAAEASQRRESYRQALDAVLRLDPDVIMVGEIRDYSSAVATLAAADTGHLVWTTLHARDALRCVERLVNMGLSATQVLDHTLVAGLVAQRLVPILCAHCSLDWSSAKGLGYFDHVPRFAHQVEALFAGRESLLAGVRTRHELGCERCKDGYVRRAVIAEVVTTTDALMLAYAGGAKSGSSDGLRAAQRHWFEHDQGVRLAEHGVVRLLEGQVDPLDLDRVASLVAFDPQRWDPVLRFAERNGFACARGYT